MWFDIFLKVWNKKEHLIIYVVFFKSTLWWRIWGSYKYHTTNMHCSFRLLIVLLQMFFLNHTYPFCYQHNFFFLHLFFLHNTNTLAYCVFLIRADDTWTHEHAVHMENLHAKWKRKWKPELAPKNRKDRLVQKCKNKITTKQNKS